MYDAAIQLFYHYFAHKGFAVGIMGDYYIAFTTNENMPFRCLEYITRIYEGIIPVKTRYAEKVFKIPNPDCYVVYVGKKPQPAEQELRLSDAFFTKDNSKLERVVKVKNCTDPNLLPIVKKCDILKQYCRFIEIIKIAGGYQYVMC